MGLTMPDDTAWAAQYRAGCSEPPLTAHDERILSRASRIAGRARFRKRFLLAAAAAAICAWIALPVTPPVTSRLPEAGLIEGTSQNFLLQITESRFAPGSMEAR